MKKKINSSKTLTLRQNSLWNIVGTIIYSFSQWGLLIVIANMANPEMVGIFTLGLAISAPIIMLLNLSLRTALVTEDDNYNFNLYWTFRLLTSIIYLIIFVLICYLYIKDTYIFLVCLFIGIAKFFESLSDILFGVMQKEHRMDLIAKSRIYKGICTLLAFYILMYISDSLLYSTIVMTLIWFLILIFYDSKNVKKMVLFSLEVSKKQIKLFKVALPLGLAHMIASLIANIPRYSIEYNFGIRELGIYASIIYLVVAGNNIIIALGNSVLPTLSNKYHKRDLKGYVKILLTILLSILAIGLLGVFLVMIFGDRILGLLYGNEFSAFKIEFIVISIYAVLMYIGKMVEFGLSSTRKFKIQPKINIITLIVVTLGTLYFIPKFGVIGAGIILIIAEIIQLFLRSVYLIKYLKF